MKKIYHKNSNHKIGRVAILILENLTFKQAVILEIFDNKTTHREAITIINVFALEP